MNNAQPFLKDLSYINKSRLIFRIGIDAGFFSEYNNMIFALHYCLGNKIYFILNSNNANFSYSKGWEDYFLPFTVENQNILNKFYNTRLAHYSPVRIRDKIGHQIYRFWLKLKRIDLITWQILSLSRNQNPNQSYQIAELGLKGNLYENCSVLSGRIWKFQPHIKEQIDRIQSSLNIANPYVGFHIRRGDKQMETEFIPIETYIKKAEEITQIRNAFVATDDYSVIDQLKSSFPDWSFNTLAKPSDAGYNQISQSGKSKTQIKEEMINLFAEVELLMNSDYFFGTFSSNISLFLAMHMPRERCIGVDFNEWRIW